MPLYRLTLTFEDDYGGETVKILTGEFADFAAAETARAALVTDWQAATSAAIVQTALAEITNIASTPTAGSSAVFRMNSTLNLATGNKKANFQLPAPAPAIRSGNALNAGATAWTDVIKHFEASSGWEISDGEHIVSPVGDATVSGRVISVRSGDKLLPT